MCWLVVIEACFFYLGVLVDCDSGMFFYLGVLADCAEGVFLC